MNRYQKHQIYKYGFYLLINDAGISGFFVGREIHHNNSKCFRITDISFKEIDANISRNTFEKFLREIDAEYIDLIYFSSKKSALDYLGFEENNAQDFVPHLFEPFVEDHIEVLLAYLSTEEVSFFKGDSDLDRPNQVI